MSNEQAVIDALCSMPFAGAVFDYEPFPIGEVLRVEDVPLTAKRVDMRIHDRYDEEHVIDRSVVFVYAGRTAVACADVEEENGDGS